MSWTTNFENWTQQSAGVSFRGDFPHAQTISDGLQPYPKFNGTKRIKRQPPVFAGYDHITVTSINMGGSIDTSTTSGNMPLALYASAKNVVAIGSRDLTSEPIRSYEHLEHRWIITKSDGSPVEYGDEIIDPNSNTVINPYTSQVGGEAFFILREDGEYTLQLTSIAPDGRTNFIRETITVDFPTYQHVWHDALNGNDANDGFDPWGFACTNATYTESTGELTEVGKFTSYDHAAATADVSTNNYNWIYLGATFKWRRIASKTDNDTIVLFDKLGSDQVALTSSDGPTQTYTGGAAGDFFTHLRGNSGASVYTITSETSSNGGSTTTDDLRVGGYDGTHVSLVADVGFTAAIFSHATNASGGLYPATSLHNMSIDGNGVADTISGTATSSVDVKLSYYLVDSCQTLRSPDQVGVLIQSTFVSKSASYYFWNLQIDNHRVAAEAKRQGLFTTNQIGNTAYIGGSITGEADNNILDHYWYPSEYADHLLAKWIFFTGGINYNYCINLNVEGASDINYITIADCYGEGDVNWFTDASNPNNDPELAGMENLLIARNTVNGSNQGFMFHYNGKQYTALDNTFIGGIFEMFVLASAVDVDFDPNDYSYVTSRNYSYGEGLDRAVDDPSCAREVVDNISFITATATTALAVDSNGFDSTAIYGDNNLYAPNDLDGLIVSDDATLVTLAAFDSATGFFNTSTDPGWTDPLNGDFT